MIFTEPLFLFLLFPLACFLFYLFTPKRGPSFGLGILLVISLLFYLPWGWEYFGLLVLSITANFFAAYILLATPDEKKKRRKAALALGLLYNFGSLGWFKYMLPLLHHYGLITGTSDNFSVVDIAIPIGISFYTFQQAIFLVDAYNRDASVVAFFGSFREPWGRLRGYVHHAFFVSFFPHLVIGPIVYLKEFQPQVENPQFGRLRLRDLEVGLTLVAIGLFKKVVLADNLAPIANHVFHAVDVHHNVSMASAWVGALAYYAQLYFDFSGYSDMALGLARTLGVRFPINFFSPLKSVSIADFYRRWHITLTRVIARFLYIPLSVAGTRFAMERRWGKLPTRMISQWLPLLVNFEVIALWHGPYLTFVVFGLIHGIWYVAETEVRISKPWKKFKKATSNTTRAVLGRMLFTLPMLFTFALFRSSSLESFFALVGRMFSFGPGAFQLKLGPADVVCLLAACSAVWLLPNAYEFLRRYRPGIATYANEYYGLKSLSFAWRANAFWGVTILSMSAIAMYYFNRPSIFLYMGF